MITCQLGIFLMCVNLGSQRSFEVSALIFTETAEMLPRLKSKILTKMLDEQQRNTEKADLFSPAACVCQTMVWFTHSKSPVVSLIAEINLCTPERRINSASLASLRLISQLCADQWGTLADFICLGLLIFSESRMMGN